MSKLVLNKPLFLVLYGFPGSGKTTFARQFCEAFQAVHVQADRIRAELFEKPRYDKSENQVVEHLVDYMVQEFLNAGVSVVYDAEVIRVGQRRVLRETARKAKAHYLLAWFQIDVESAFTRISKRDRRTIDGKYARGFNRTEYDAYIAAMQHPTKDEDFVVLSGKHSFGMQRSSLMKRFHELSMVSAEEVSTGVTKPGMVNLVPSAGRVDMTRRNITIR
jgi:predicted kinase